PSSLASAALAAMGCGSVAAGRAATVFGCTLAAAFAFAGSSVGFVSILAAILAGMASAGTIISILPDGCSGRAAGGCVLSSGSATVAVSVSVSDSLSVVTLAPAGAGWMPIASTAFVTSGFSAGGGVSGASVFSGSVSVAS